MGEKIKNVLAERIKIDGRKTLTAKGLDAGIVADRLLEIYRGSIKSDL